MKLMGNVNQISDDIREFLDASDGEELVVESYETGNTIECPTEQENPPRLLVPEETGSSKSFEDYKFPICSDIEIRNYSYTLHSSFVTWWWHGAGVTVLRIDPNKITDKPLFAQTDLIQDLLLDALDFELDESPIPEEKIFTEFYESKIDPIQGIKAEVESLRERKHNIQEDLRDTQKQLRDEYKKLEHLEDMPSEERAQEFLEDLKELHFYQDVSITSTGNLVGITTPVSIRDVPLGSYKVIINPQRNRVQVKRHQNNLEYKGVYHPHVWESGSPCLGNFGPTVSKLLTSHEYGDLLEIMRHFLSQYNADSPVKPIKLFRRQL